jgi:short-subunit dehydrogenase
MYLGMKDNVAIVTAPSKGLGKAVALGLTEEEVNIVMCTRKYNEFRNQQIEYRGEFVIFSICCSV